MLLELLEVLHQMAESGLTWATIIAVVLGILRWMEGNQKQARNERIESKLDALLRKEGITWTGQQNASQPVLRSLKVLWLWSSVVIYPGALRLIRRRRRRRMTQTINLTALFLAIAGALKLILQPFGVDLTELTDDRVNAIANGAAALLTLIGILRNNFKAKAVNTNVVPAQLESNK